MFDAFCSDSRLVFLALTMHLMLHYADVYYIAHLMLFVGCPIVA